MNDKLKAAKLELAKRELSRRQSSTEDRTNETPEETGNRMWSAIRDGGESFFNPTITKEQVLSNDIGTMMADSMPFGNTPLGYLPPPFSSMLPPAMRRQQGAEIISNESSPANIIGNTLAVGGIMVNPVKNLASQTREAFKNPKLATQAFQEWQKTLSSKAATEKAGIQSGLTQRLAEIGNEGELAARTNKDALAQSISKLKNKVSSKIGIAEGNLQKRLDGISETEKSLSAKLGRISTQEGKQLQKDSLALFQKRSEEYGSRLGKLMETAEDVPAQGVHDALEQALIDHNVLTVNQYGVAEKTGGNLSTTEAKWLKMYENIDEQIKNNGATKISANDLMKTEQQLKIKYGNIWGKDEHLAASIKERLGDTLKDSVEGLSELRQEFSPYLNLKRESIKKLGIFGDTAKSSAAIRRSATPMGKTGSEERRVLGLLEKELERPIGKNTKIVQGGFNSLIKQKTLAREEAKNLIGNYKKSLGEEIYSMRKNNQTEIDSIKAQYDLLKQTHKDDAEYIINKIMNSKDASIERLRGRINNLQDKYKSARFRTKVGTGLAISATPVGKYLLRHAIEAILNGR